MVTIKDIAKRLGIAPSTVSKGLNDANDISPELKKLVLDTAIEMGYVTKRMKKETRKRLCVFVENMQYEKPGDFGFDIILGFKQAAVRDNWEVTVTPVTPMLQTRDPYDRYMVQNGFHGGFLVGFALKDPWMAQMETTTIPTVLDHLTELGHTKIALLNGSPDSMVTVNRYDAYVSSMQNHKLKVDKDLVAHGYYVEESAKYHLPSLIENGATAILCGNDLLAVGVIRECRRLHVKIPQELSVVGFDNLPVAAEITPALTTINQDRTDLGRNSYAALYWLIAKVPISRSLLRPRLVVRDSTAKAAQKGAEL